MSLVLAHFGHWYVQLIFAAPVLLLCALLGGDRVRQRWRERRGRSSAPTREKGPQP